MRGWTADKAIPASKVSPAGFHCCRAEKTGMASKLRSGVFRQDAARTAM